MTRLHSPPQKTVLLCMVNFTQPTATVLPKRTASLTLDQPDRQVSFRVDSVEQRGLCVSICQCIQNECLAPTGRKVEWFPFSLIETITLTVPLKSGPQFYNNKSLPNCTSQSVSVVNVSPVVIRPYIFLRFYYLQGKKKHQQISRISLQIFYFLSDCRL